MTNPTASERAAQLAVNFFDNVWGGDHDLDKIDTFMTEDYVITSGGVRIEGRPAFKQWVGEFQRKLLDARTVNLEAFANATGDRVVSRWVCTGRNNGIFGLPADGREVSFTGIAIWRVRDDRLAECWVERSALELYFKLTAKA